MDENTNNSNQHPEVVTPDSQKETPETPSTPESHPTESTSESASSAPDVPSSSESEEDKPEDSASSDAVAPAAAVPPEEPKETDPTDVAPATDSEKSPAPGETPAPAAPATAAATPAPGVIGTPSVPTDDTDSPSPSANASPIVPGPADKKKLTKIVAIVAIVILLAIIAIIVAMSMGSKKTPAVTTSSTVTSTPATVKVDTWTGKANTYNWDTAANWSLGVPVNGEGLAFNVSSIKKPSSNTAVTFQNNIPSLTVSKLLIDGTGVGFIVKGNPLTITNGISQDITLASKTAGPAQVTFENAITFAANQSVQAAANNTLSFVGSTTGGNNNDWQ